MTNFMVKFIVQSLPSYTTKTHFFSVKHFTLKKFFTENILQFLIFFVKFLNDCQKQLDTLILF